MREGGEASQADPQAAAQEVYDRWLARAQEENLLTVEGVGVLAFKNFTPDEAFERRLNPQGREPVKIRARAVSTGHCGSALRRFWSP